MLKYKIDVIKSLKDKGYSTYKIRKDNILGQAQLTALNKKKPIHWTTIGKICDILDCQPNDIIENIKPL